MLELNTQTLPDYYFLELLYIPNIQIQQAQQNVQIGNNHMAYLKGIVEKGLLRQFLLF